MHSQLIRSITYSSEGRFQEKLQTVQKKTGALLNYLAALVFRLEFTLTSASTSAAITAGQWAGILPSLKVKLVDGTDLFPNGFLSGSFFREMNRYLLKRGYKDAAAIAVDTNTARTVKVDIFVPFYNPKSADPSLALFPSAFIDEVHGAFAVSTIFSTGQVISAASLKVIAVHRPRDVLEVGPMLRYGETTFKGTFDDQLSLGQGGKMIALAIANHACGAAGALAVNDFTHAEFKGENVAFASAEDIDDASLVSDLFGDNDSDLVEPSDAVSYSFPIWTAPEGWKASVLPYEVAPRLKLTAGAGNPGYGDQVATWALLERRDELAFGKLLAKSGLHVDPRGDGIAIQPVTGAQGRGGQIVDDRDMVEPFLRRKIATATAVRG